MVTFSFSRIKVCNENECSILLKFNYNNIAQEIWKEIYCKCWFVCACVCVAQILWLSLSLFFVLCSVITSLICVWMYKYVYDCMAVSSPFDPLPVGFLLILRTLSLVFDLVILSSYLHTAQVLHSVCFFLARSVDLCVCVCVCESFLFFYFVINLKFTKCEVKKYEVKIPKLRNSIKCTNTQANERLCFSHFCSRFKYSSRPKSSFFPHCQ